METSLISEENYMRTMKDEVEPWLAARRKVFWACRKTGQRIYCERYLAEDPRGVVLISHGFKETTAKYAETLWYFLHEGYHVYIPEHCGHGRSYRLVEDLSLVHVDSHKRYIADLLAVARMAREDIDRNAGGASLPMYLYGHSMGGGIAIAAAARAPELFERIVLSSPMIRPLTGPFPYGVTVVGSATMCLFGQGKKYSPGSHPYRGIEDFEKSSSVCLPRFMYYQEIKKANPLFRTAASSIGWVRAATQLEAELMYHSVGKTGTPMLIFQAGQDGAVSADAQDEFVRERNKKYPGSTILLKLPGSKHEIFNSHDEVAKIFWDELFAFLSDRI